MKLLIHQCTHEFRKHWVLVIGFIALFFLGQQQVISSSAQDWSIAESLAYFLNAATFLLFAFLVAAPFLADSLAKHDRHLTTRPLPRISLYGGKALFIFSGVILPVLVINALVSLHFGETSTILRTLTADWLLVLTALALLIASFTVHQRSALSLVISSILALFIVVGFWELFDWLHKYTLFFRFLWIALTPTPFALFFGALIFVLGLLALAAKSVRTPINRPRLFLLQFGLILLSILATNQLSQFDFRVPPPHQKELTEILLQPENPIEVHTRFAEFVPSPNRQPFAVSLPIVMQEELASRFPYADLTYAITQPPLPRLLSNYYAQQYRESLHRTHPVFSPIEADSLDLSPGFTRLIQKHFPRVRSIIPISEMTKEKWRSSSTPFSAFPTTETTTATEIDIPIGNWTTKAIIPLAARSSRTRNPLRLLDYGWWEDKHFEITLQQSHIPTHLLKPERLIDSTPNYLCAIYLPEHKLLQFGRITTDDLAIRSNLLYLNQLRIYFDDLPKGSFQTAKAQLVIFKSSEIGSVSIPFQKNLPGFERSGPAPHRQWSRSTDIKIHHSGELALWIRKHRPLAESSPEEVSQFLNEYSRLASSSHKQIFWDTDTIAPFFAPLVESHLALFLDQISFLDQHSSQLRVFVRAVSLGASPKQKQEVIAAAMDTPILMNCLLERGWYREGEEVFRRHLLKRNTHSEFQLDALRGLLPVDRPENDRLFLELISNEPSYDFLHHIVRTPRLYDTLQESSLSTWKQALFALPPARTSELLPPKLSLALTLGDENALPDLFFILRFSQKTDRGSVIGNHVQGFFLPPAVFRDPSDNQLLVSWLLEHEPSDFRFDSVLQRFVPRANNSKDSNS